MDSLAETALRPGYRGTLGLVLTGGGARSAYQVGVLLAPPRSMLDNTPLRELLGTHVDCAGIRRSIERGHLRAFALCSTSYGTGHSVAFFDGVDSIPDWARVQRVGCRTQLGVDHVM